MATAFYNLPKAYEFFFRYHPIIVHIDRVEEFFGGYFSECALPVIKRFLFVNFLGAIYVKDAEHCFNSSLALWWKFLEDW